MVFIGQFDGSSFCHTLVAAYRFLAPGYSPLDRYLGPFHLNCAARPSIAGSVAESHDQSLPAHFRKEEKC